VKVDEVRGQNKYHHIILLSYIYQIDIEFHSIRSLKLARPLQKGHQPYQKIIWELCN
jgi:hypothetical protein